MPNSLNTPLADIQEVIERSVFEAIRKQCVAKGYTPDIADTLTYPDTPAGYTQYQTDLQAIWSQVPPDPTFPIEIFSNANNEYTGQKKAPRIVIVSQDFLPGALGGDSTRIYQRDTDSDPYTALVLPPQSADFHLNIHLVSQTVEQQRILNAILSNAIPRRGYIKRYTVAGDDLEFSGNLFIKNFGYVDVPGLYDGMMEKVFRYEVSDVWETECVEDGTFAEIQEINVDINITDDEDPNDFIDLIDITTN